MPTSADMGGYPMWHRYMENKDGVHLTIGEFTLCGDAFDEPYTEKDWEPGQFKVARHKPITCKRCASIIRTCRGVRVAT